MALTSPEHPRPQGLWVQLHPSLSPPHPGGRVTEAALPPTPRYASYCLAMARQLESRSNPQDHERLAPQSSGGTLSTVPPLFLPPGSPGISAAFCQVGTWLLALPVSLPRCSVTQGEQMRAGLWGERLVCMLPTWGAWQAAADATLADPTVADGTPARPSAAPQLWRPVGSDGGCWHRIPWFTEPSACGCCALSL